MAQENLLPQLYTYASSLTPIELEAMLNEDPEHMQKRAAAQLAVRVRFARQQPPAGQCERHHLPCGLLIDKRMHIDDVRRLQYAHEWQRINDGRRVACRVSSHKHDDASTRSKSAGHELVPGGAAPDGRPGGEDARGRAPAHRARPQAGAAAAYHDPTCAWLQTAMPCGSFDEQAVFGHATATGHLAFPTALPEWLWYGCLLLKPLNDVAYSNWSACVAS